MQQKSLSSIKIYGFGIIKNGVKFDFPFKESIYSLKPIVDKVFYVLGDSEDSTNLFFQNQDFINTRSSVWDKSLQKGLVLSVETNKALNFLRDSVDLDGAWGIYLQADEVLHEDDYELIKNDIIRAENEGFDAISFRYLHFWQTHHDLAISKSWYPHEIRAIKLKSNIESWGDAQSFKNMQKIFYTEARIYHYGHVRERKAYEDKMHTMGSMYHKGFKFYRKKILSYFKRHKHKTIPFFGNHPKIMQERILRLNDIWSLPKVEEIYIVGDSKLCSQEFLEKINAQKINWVMSPDDIPSSFKGEITYFDSKYVKKTNVPLKMASPFAKEWNPEFRLTLLLSEKNVGLK